MKKTFLKFSIIVITLLAVSACGYHLREAYQLPAEYTPVFVDSPRQYRDLYSSFKRELKRGGIATSDSMSDANLIISLDNVSEVDELLTASATGSPLERELILKASISWKDSSGTNVLSSETVTLRRTFVFDETAVLSKSREADRLMRELENELIRRVILRLRQL